MEEKEFKQGKFIGSGTQGVVFNGKTPNQVIKIDKVWFSQNIGNKIFDLPQKVIDGLYSQKGSKKKSKEYWIYKKLEKGQVLKKNFSPVLKSTNDGNVLILQKFPPGWISLLEYITQFETPRKSKNFSFEVKLDKTQMNKRIRILCNLLIAILKMHEMGVCHGDIKHDNIIINPETFDVMLIDYGLAIGFNKSKSGWNLDPRMDKEFINWVLNSKFKEENIETHQDFFKACKRSDIFDDMNGFMRVFNEMLNIHKIPENKKLFEKSLGVCPLFRNYEALQSGQKVEWPLYQHVNNILEEKQVTRSWLKRILIFLGLIRQEPTRKEKVERILKNILNDFPPESFTRNKTITVAQLLGQLQKDTRIRNKFKRDFNSVSPFFISPPSQEKSQMAFSSINQKKTPLTSTTKNHPHI
jgi:serine/threonine protein kinase